MGTSESRVIKQYPFDEKIGDEVICHANQIQELRLPSFQLKYFDINNNSVSYKDYIIRCFAKEEEKGVFVRIIGVKENETPEMIASRNPEEDEDFSEVVIDEIEFCDNLYNAAVREEFLGNSEYIHSIIHDLSLKHAKDKMINNGQYFFNMDYNGFGLVYSGDDNIATIDSIRFTEESPLILMHCVGNADLNNISNCKIDFLVEDIYSFRIDNFNMESVEGEDEYTCSYKLKDIDIKHISRLKFNKQTMKSMHSYSKDNIEQFVEERNSLLIKKDKTNFDLDFDDIDDD